MTHKPEFKIEMKEPTDEECRELRERLSHIRLGLLDWAPFFGHLVMKLEPIVARPHHGIATAGVTRDRKLFLNYEFCKQLNNAEFIFVLAHEVMHLAYLVFQRGEGRDAVLMTPNGPVTAWNLAHDAAINDIIIQMSEHNPDVQIPDIGIFHDVKWRDWAAEEIYDDILDQASKNGPPIQMPGFGTGDLRPELGGDGDQKQDGPNGEAQCKGGGDDLSETEGNALDEYWKVSVVEAAQVHEQKMRENNGRGFLPASLRKMIDEILNPKISWVDVLSRWVGENGRRANFSYRRPSRRSESVGEILPSIVKHGVDDIVVLWDTSGSMGGREVEILAEVLGICEDLSMSLRVICCDTRVASDQSDVQHADDIEWAGGGGSDFTPAFDRLHEEGYSGVVVTFTDGYIGVPDTKPPHIRDVLWILWDADTHGDVDPTGGKWGEVVRVGADGYVMNERAAG